MMAPYEGWAGHPPKTPRSDTKGFWERFWEWFDDNLLLVDYGWRDRSPEIRVVERGPGYAVAESGGRRVRFLLVDPSSAYFNQSPYR